MRVRFGVCAFVLFTLLVASASGQGTGTTPSPPDSTTGPLPKEQPKKIRVGGNVAQANLVNAVAPEYPEEAKAAHISGTVLLHAIIGTDGTIQRLEYISGPPLLMTPAFDAVHQWRYKPTLLNRHPIEVDTTISVVYTTEGWVDPRQKTTTSVHPIVPQEAAPQPVAPKPAAPVDPQVRADIQRLFDLWGLKGMMKELARNYTEALRRQIIASLPDTPNRYKIMNEYIERYASLVSDTCLTKIAEIYGRNLTDDDIKGLIQFYGTPAGKDYFMHLPYMTVEMFRWGRILDPYVNLQVVKQLCEGYPELQGQGDYCAQAAKLKENSSSEPVTPK
jgi:hypothetical protein